MSFKHRNVNLEKDNMNIKAHLDASLDANNIIPSERLINRTLEAIKNAQSNTSGFEEPENTSWSVIDEKRRYSWPVFAKGMASVAAALLILVVGMNAFRMMKSSKKDATSYDSKADAGMDYGKQANRNEQPKGESSASYSIETDDAADDNGAETERTAGLTADQATTAEGKTDEADNDGGLAISEGLGENFGVVKGNTSKLETGLSLRDICPVPADAAEELTITLDDAAKTVIIADKAGVEEFFTLYEGYELFETDEMPGEIVYSAEIIGGGSACRVAIYKTGITVSQTLKKETVTNSYSVVNHEQLLVKLGKMIERYELNLEE